MYLFKIIETDKNSYLCFNINCSDGKLRDTVMIPTFHISDGVPVPRRKAEDPNFKWGEPPTEEDIIKQVKASTDLSIELDANPIENRIGPWGQLAPESEQPIPVTSKPEDYITFVFRTPNIYELGILTISKDHTLTMPFIRLAEPMKIDGTLKAI